MTFQFGRFLEWIETTDLSFAIRQSTWLYPFIEIIHLFGIVLVAGGAVLFDIQLLTTSRHQRFTENNFRLLSWSKAGLIIAVPSGLLLFITNAVALGNDPVFAAKLLLLALAGVNAYIFHIRVFQPYHARNQLSFRWNTATANAIFSIIIWASVIACGRLLAY